MVINEKALIRQMKEAYKNQGYTVAVVGSRMMFNNGYWVATVDVANVPNELLGMLAQHIRDVPKEGQSYKVTKTKTGPFVQSRILEEAIEPLTKLATEKQNEKTCLMRRTDLTMNGAQLWQDCDGPTMYMIDPRYAVLFADHNAVVRLGNGIYAEGEISNLWVLRVADHAAEGKIQHLEKMRWVK